MELQIINPTKTISPFPFGDFTSPYVNGEQKQKQVRTPFIESNTTDVNLQHIKNDCIIPVFAKDNERTIAHYEFIDEAINVAERIFGKHQVMKPEIRVSHTIKGRTPDAVYKDAKQLLEHEKTLYYERMAFAIEIEGHARYIDGQLLQLTIGGVRAYNQDNLYNKKSLESFKFFIGYKNLVCCNMCISSDGFVENLRVSSKSDLSERIESLINQYDAENHFQKMKDLEQYELTEHQFAQLLGKCRLHQYLPKDAKRQIPLLQFNDTQLNHVARDYFQDESFSRNANGNIDLWKMYNLFTGTNKSSYIDLYLLRGLNAFELATGIGNALREKSSSYRWFVD